MERWWEFVRYEVDRSAETSNTISGILCHYHHITVTSILNMDSFSHHKTCNSWQMMCPSYSQGECNIQHQIKQIMSHTKQEKQKLDPLYRL